MLWQPLLAAVLAELWSPHCTQSPSSQGRACRSGRRKIYAASFALGDTPLLALTSLPLPSNMHDQGSLELKPQIDICRLLPGAKRSDYPSSGLVFYPSKKGEWTMSGVLVERSICKLNCVLRGPLWERSTIPSTIFQVSDFIATPCIYICIYIWDSCVHFDRYVLCFWTRYFWLPHI